MGGPARLDDGDVAVEDFAADFAALPTAYLAMSPDPTIVEANPACLALLGRTRDELIGRYVFDDFPPGRLMLGVDRTSTRGETVVEVPPGATVLLCTDGLVERPGSDLDAGVGRLDRLAAELVHLPPEELCDQLLDRLVDGHTSDDVALVAVRQDGARA